MGVIKRGRLAVAAHGCNTHTQRAEVQAARSRRDRFATPGLLRALSRDEGTAVQALAHTLCRSTDHVPAMSKAWSTTGALMATRWPTGATESRQPPRS